MCTKTSNFFLRLAKLYPVAYNYGMGKISDHELARLAYVSRTISELQDEEKELKQRVRDAYSDGEYVRRTDAGTLLVVVAASTKLDPKFVDTHPADEYPWLYKAVPDTTAVQKATGKKFYVPDTSRVTVKLVDSV